MKRNDVIDFAD